MSDTWTRARTAARALRHRFTNDDAAPAQTMIRAVLADAGLSIHFLSRADSLLAGSHAVLDRDTDAIWVRDDVPPPVYGFLVAHELGHFYLHPEYTVSGEYEGVMEGDAQTGAFLVGYGPRERRETEANVWARELLLPVAVAHRLFFREGQTAPEIAERFGVAQSVVFTQLQVASENSLPTETDSPAPLSLDDSQRGAATATHCPLLLGAGPGTGKTRTLVARVQYLLQGGNAPETVLVLTFSRKATAELRDRLQTHLPQAVARRVAVCTFHAFGLDLLRRYHRHAHLPPNPVLLTQAESFALMEARIAPDVGTALWFAHDPTYPLRDCLQVIGRLKEEMVTPDTARARADATGNPKQQAVAAIYARYENTLREKGALDSADLVCRAVSLLSENAAVREREQARWRHILVDEYQDVNRAGAKLVQLLGGDGAGVWCVGDLRQAIYRFRGASPANVSRFCADFPGGVRRDLAVNYRSRPPIVSCLGQVADKNAALWQGQRTDAALTAPCVTLAVADTEAAQIAGIAGEITKLREQDPAHRWRDFAVLCRTNPQASAICAGLAKSGIPAGGGVDTLAWLRDETVRELLLLLSLTCAEQGELASRTGWVLPAHLRSRTTPEDFLCAALYGASGLARTAKTLHPAQTLLSLAKSFATQADLLAPGDSANAAFLHHVRRIAHLKQSPRTADNAEPSEGADTVQVLTVHAAKGLEFPVVFVPNLSAGRFPPQPRPSVIGDADTNALLDADADDMDDESRLFFVAISRARDYLFLSFAEKYENRAAQPSPLLAPVGGIAEVTRVRWTQGVATVAPPNCPPADDGRPLAGAGGQFGGATDRQGATAPTPAHELDRYLRCPRRYFYETVCGYGDTRARTAYDALKSATRSVLRGASGDAAFETAWREQGFANNDPWLTAYRAEWETIHRHLRTTEERQPVPVFQHDFVGGAVAIRADAVAPDGAVERLTFAKGKETGRADAGNTLLFTAVPKETVVRVRHVRTGEERVIESTNNASTRRARENHLAGYDRALRGIRLRVFDATPEDAGDCADCAYLLICD